MPCQQGQQERFLHYYPANEWSICPQSINIMMIQKGLPEDASESSMKTRASHRG